MPDRLLFPDPHSAADAMVFASRTARLTEDAVRLRAADGVLAMTAAALAPRGLGDATPTVLGMRLLRVDPELVCDLVVTAADLRTDATDPSAVILPDVAVTAAWAGVSPPRSGWQTAGEIEADALRRHGAAGVAEVARALPDAPGDDVVRGIRSQIWGAPDPELLDLPRGVAFAAVALGFVNGPETARVLRAGPWSRIPLARGHILVRGPHATGLTGVRTTGTSR